jgi:YHS domain-containing protein
MLPGPTWAILTDPVCGRAVEFSSPHRTVYGGALFAFCSVGCQAHFLELPSRYAVIMAQAPLSLLEPRSPVVAAASAQPTARPAHPASAPLPLASVPSPAAKPAAPAPASAAPEPDPAAAAVTTNWAPLPDGMDMQGERGAFTWLQARRERRFARECAREMLEFHRDLSTRYPELKGHSLYRRVVARRLEGNDLVAEAVLHHATQSFAIWPVERPLNFRDVVHYLAVSQYVALNPSARWVHADIRRVVDGLVPAQL